MDLFGDCRQCQVCWSSSATPEKECNVKYAVLSLYVHLFYHAQYCTSGQEPAHTHATQSSRILSRTTCSCPRSHLPHDSNTIGERHVASTHVHHIHECSCVPPSWFCCYAAFVAAGGLPAHRARASEQLITTRFLNCNADQGCVRVM